MERDADLHIAGLSIWVRGYAFPDRNDWDSNFLLTRARVVAPGAFAECEWLMEVTDLTRFTAELAALDKSLAGQAKLECLEPNLKVDVAVGKLGSVTVIVDITPDHMTQSHHFQFEADQTFFPQWLAQCRFLLTQYPQRAEVRSG